MVAGSAAMRGQVRAASWHKGEAQLARHGVGHTDQPMAPRCLGGVLGRSPSAHERGHLTAGYRGGGCATTRRRHRPDTRSLTALVAEYSAGAQRP